jgi:hypothetical protein
MLVLFTEGNVLQYRVFRLQYRIFKMEDYLWGKRVGDIYSGPYYKWFSFEKMFCALLVRNWNLSYIFSDPAPHYYHYIVS